jgi:hypothetical protein
MEHPKETISTLLPQIVRSCRLGDYGDAANGLNKCVPAFEAFKNISNAKNLPKQLLNTLNYSLETVVLMLQNKDWVAVADVIEYELLMLWREISRYMDEEAIQAFYPKVPKPLTK